MNLTSIALIGPSGSGKSIIGLCIAKKLGWTFRDSDREIEADCGMTVSEIFRAAGEEEFRRLESQYLKAMVGNRTQNFVLSTGGGMPIFNDNMNLLESFATLVYLIAPLEVLVTRIKSGEDRPLLSGSETKRDEAADNQLILRLGKLIAERESIYNRARYKIDTSSADPEQLADDIIEMAGLVLQPAAQGKDHSRDVSTEG